MSEEIHIHHHFSPHFYEALERLAISQHSIAELLSNTKKIREKLNKMADDQAVLEEKIAAIQASENQEAATLVAVKEAIDTLKAAHPAIDFTSVDALLAASAANTAAAGDDLTDATT